MKSEVYSWRVSSDIKTSLEREARRQNKSVAAVLDMAAREWLNRLSPDSKGDEEQVRLHGAASKLFGVFAGIDTRRAENARQSVGRRLRSRHDR